MLMNVLVWIIRSVNTQQTFIDQIASKRTSVYNRIDGTFSGGNQN